MPANSVTGVIYDANGPVAKATVRIQGTTNATVSDYQGQFTLSSLSEGVAVTISAWKEGYYCAKAEGVKPPVNGITLTLRMVQTNDYPGYEWIPPIGGNSCYSCKPGVTQVWLDNDAHSRSTINPRFLTMYYGTDVEGNQSPLTRYSQTRDYGRIPLPPDPSQPYFGPGYKLDFPATAGNCSACHVPGAAINAPYGTDPTQVSGANSFGVHCDFCHKIADVNLDQATQLPFPNMPGVLSMDIRRPFPQDKDRYQIFFGTFDDDNVPLEDTYLPLLKESRFCAPCHFGVFWDTPVYNSFGEWLASPYSNPASGKTCQQCHMPAPTVLDGNLMTNVAPGKGGIDRDPLTIHAHTFPGTTNLELMQNAVSLTTTLRLNENKLAVNVKITNDRTGHAVPTDSPLRHLILLVQAEGDNGQPLEQLSGPTVPEWGGVGDSTRGYYAGLPGKAFAKVLEELWTGVSPTGAYWNPTRLVSDNRLAPLASDTSSYTFATPQSGRIKVQVRLIFRRAYKMLMDWKGWEASDIEMEVWEGEIE